ncbi:MAG TPA: HlyD family secretion protein [Bryobacteraceae bacterium]|nr:HlyD family secretion protein [Bryobacteraceae bacterium]
MPDEQAIHPPDSEIAELREQVRRLREQQEQQQRQLSSGNGHSDNQRQNEGKPPDEAEGRQPKKRHPLRNAILIFVGAAILIVAVLWWLHSRNYESTDDATVEAHITGLAARVTGIITAAYADQNQYVKAGQVLVDLDPRDYQAELEQAQAQLAQAQNQTVAEQPNVPVTQTTTQTNIATSNTEVSGAQAALAAAERNYDAAVARIRESEATSAKAQADVDRYRPLVERDEVPREQFDQVVATAKAQAAMVAANRESAEAARRQVDQARAQVVQAQQRASEAAKNAPRQIAMQRANLASRESAVQAARAAVDRAMLNLSYCKITTPLSGIIAKRMAEVGQGVTPGQQLFLITESGDLWVTANFRETQLRRMRPGQSARIHVDALSADFDGYIESMPAATGSVMGLLPPENATGNFVKVVQRLPVRIRFKPNQSGLERLRPGMSVEPKVAVG